MALLQLCSQPTAFFAALEVDCKSLTLRHCGTWLETQRCNFTMPKRKLGWGRLFAAGGGVLQLYHAKAETVLAGDASGLETPGCNFTMPKRKHTRQTFQKV